MRITAVRTRLVRLIDRMQGVAVRHQRLMRGVAKVSTLLEMPRCLTVMLRGVLVVRRGCFDMHLLAVLRVHAGSCAPSGLPSRRPVPRHIGGSQQKTNLHAGAPSVAVNLRAAEGVR
ncbi:hypothetical protein PUN4_60088 [Paraburkholderia unamae]|nr:hypothetical protein PUN4_60088 [Paraburkholderia unamae]